MTNAVKRPVSPAGCANDGPKEADRRGLRGKHGGNLVRKVPVILGVAAVVVLGGCASDGGGGNVYKPAAPTPPPAASKTPAKKASPKPGKAAGKQAAPKRTGKFNACRVKSPSVITFSKPVEPSKLVTIAAVGDVLLHDSVQKRSAGLPEGFAALFAGVSDLIRSADIAFANLEGPAAPGIAKNGKKVKEPKRRYDGRVYSGYPLFNYHPSIASDLRGAGFDIVLTANNHSLDRYAAGADATVAAVKAAGLAYTGTRTQTDKKSPWYTVTGVSKGGKSYNIAWLGCSYSTNGIPDRKGQVLMCYKQRGLVLSTIKALAARKDIAAVILAPHWGNEYRHRPNRRQISLARAALNAGATAVIGTHPHVIQPIERFTTADGRETLIAYSLGNFLFENTNDPAFRQGSYGLWNARVGANILDVGDLLGTGDSQLGLAMFAYNILGKDFLIDAGNTGNTFGVPTFVAGPPRLWGGEVTYMF